jgi:hypothetical protein
MSLSRSSHVLRELSVYQIVRCLTRETRRSRVYALTENGVRCRERLTGDRTEAAARPMLDYRIWHLLSWVSFRHRSAMLKAMDRPLQPCAVKRRARFLIPDLRMSATNCRDSMRLFVERGIARPVWLRKHRHPQYELTEVGRQLQRLLWEAEACGNDRRAVGG